MFYGNIISAPFHELGGGASNSLACAVPRTRMVAMLGDIDIRAKHIADSVQNFLTNYFQIVTFKFG